MTDSLNEKSLPTSKPTEIDPDKLAQSFEVDFLNTKHSEVASAMLHIGNFIFDSSGLNEDGTVYYSGQDKDGTKIKITIEKGKEYKTPYEKHMERINEETRGKLSGSIVND